MEDSPKDKVQFLLKLCSRNIFKIYGNKDLFRQFYYYLKTNFYISLFSNSILILIDFQLFFNILKLFQELIIQSKLHPR